MAKITAKHFLNTNLKPYLINKEKHYSVYISLVAYRKNTKVKSIVLDEYYNENTFNEIINSSDEYDINLIENEINTISLITEISVEVLKEFDTAFITSYFKFSSLINIDSSIEYDKYLKDKSSKINDVERIMRTFKKYDKYFSIVESIEKDFEYYDADLMNKYLGIPGTQKYTMEITFIEKLMQQFEKITIFDFFNKTNQTLLLKFIKSNFKDGNHQEFIFELNKAIFTNSLNRFLNYIQKSKNKYLIEKYQHIFDSSYKR